MNDSNEQRAARLRVEAWIEAYTEQAAPTDTLACSFASVPLYLSDIQVLLKASADHR